MFPFARFPGVDLILGPEMRSTGEVMGLDTDFGRAFAKSQLGSGIDLPLQGCVFVSVREATRRRWSSRAASSPPGVSSWSRPAAPRTSSARRACRCEPSTRCRKAAPISSTRCAAARIQLVFNTTEGAQAIADSFSLRRTALTHNIPYYTTVAGVRAAVQAIGALRQGCLEVAPLQSYL